jgi:hypothetical protein
VFSVRSAPQLRDTRRALRDLARQQARSERIEMSYQGIYSLPTSQSNGCFMHRYDLFGSGDVEAQFVIVHRKHKLREINVVPALRDLGVLVLKLGQASDSYLALPVDVQALREFDNAFIARRLPHLTLKNLRKG